MTAKGNPCPVKGCTAHAKPQQLMCWPHWRRVPKALNYAVFETFRAWTAARLSDPGGVKMGEITASYRSASDAAIAAVEAKEAEERA